MKKSILFFLVCLAGCSFRDDSLSVRSVTERSARMFFERYADRSDWESFLDQYTDDMIFEDVIFRYRYEGKQAFRDFYNWPDTLFRKHPDYPQTLVLEELALTDTSAVGRGYFTPFYYAGKLYDDWEHMRFTLWLSFNEEGKIVRQVDYIEYPPAFLKSAAERLLAGQPD